MGVLWMKIPCPSCGDKLDPLFHEECPRCGSKLGTLGDLVFVLKLLVGTIVLLGLCYIIGDWLQKLAHWLGFAR